MICKNCNERFATKVEIDGKVRNLQRRKYCLTCSPFGSHNTKNLQRERVEDGVLIKSCRVHGLTEYVHSPSSQSVRCRHCRSEAVSRRRILVKLKAVEYKGGSCNDCGYNKTAKALVFHHLDPSQKDFSISRSGATRSWEKTRKELDKCVLLCQNCHAEAHEQIFKEENLDLWERLNTFAQKHKNNIPR